MSTIATSTAMPVGAPPIPSGQTPAPTKVQLPILINEEILIPNWVVDHDSYRRWAKSDEFPQKGRFSFIDGMIWVELAMEEFFSHNQLKSLFNGVLAPLIWAADIGYFGADGNLWTHPGVGISTEPDGMFFTYEALQSERIRLIKGASHGYVEIQGTPNLALEIVSDSSVKKDKQVLKEKCAKAGVDEYWLVDARNSELLFEIWRLQDGQYVPTPTDAEWLTSSVLGRAFKLEQGNDRLGHPRFRLLVRE